VTWAVADGSAGWKHRRLALGGLMAGAVGALAVCAHGQTKYWKDSESLATRALACTTGNFVALNNLGVVLFNRGKVNEAMEEFQKSLEVEPENAEVLNNLGNALATKGSDEAAITQYEKALEIQPAYADAHYDLGKVLRKEGRLDEAVAQYRKALEIAPEHVDALNNLGNALALKGEDAAAIAQYKKALEIQPGQAAAHYNLGNVLVKDGRLNEAVAQYRQALEINPDQLDAQNNLAWLLATTSDPSLRDGAKAVELAARANQLSGGGNAVILRTLAAAYAEEGSYGLAAATARRGLESAAGQKQDALAATLQKDIKLYDANTPLRNAPR